MARKKAHSKQDPRARTEASSWSSQKQRIVATAIALAVLAFVLDLTIALRLSGLGAVDQYDVLFNADTIARIECMVENECGGRSSFSHPNLAVLLNPPVQSASWVLTHTIFVEHSEAQMRRVFALVTGPLASALKASAVFFLFLLLGLRLTHSTLLSLLSIVSFSQLVFGSIPEGFALSGLLIAIAYLLCAHSIRTNNQTLWPWIVIGIVTTGITVTNLVIIVILFGTAQLYNRVRVDKVVLKAILLVAAVAVPTAVLPQMVKGTYGLREVSLKGGAEYTKRWMNTQRTVDRALETPVAWAHTIAAPAPKTARNMRAIAEGSKYDFRFTLQPPRAYNCREPLTLLLLLLLLAGVVSYRYAPRIAKWTCGASVVIVVFNWALHSVWGVELFLYSQHWQLSLLVLLAGPLFMDKPFARRFAVYVVVALILAVVVQNGATASAMLSKLESIRP